jgi:hypothetical protein
MTTTLLPTTSTTSTTTTSTTTTSTTTTSTTTITPTTTTIEPCRDEKNPNLCNDECMNFRLMENKRIIYNEKPKLIKEMKENETLIAEENKYLTDLKKAYDNYENLEEPITQNEINKKNEEINQEINIILELLQTCTEPNCESLYEDKINFLELTKLKNAEDIIAIRDSYLGSKTDKNSFLFHQDKLNELKSKNSEIQIKFLGNESIVKKNIKISKQCVEKAASGGTNCSVLTPNCFPSTEDYHNAVVNTASALYGNLTSAAAFYCASGASNCPQPPYTCRTNKFGTYCI